MRSHTPAPAVPPAARAKRGNRGAAFALAVCTAFAVCGPCGAAAAEAPDSVLGASQPGIVVSVPYVTNRRAQAHAAGQTAYGGERGATGFGRCSAFFAPIPIIDRIAPRLPFYVADETRELSIERHSDQEAFWTQVQADVARTASASVVVFVHGYNYGFERHCLAAAELQRALAGKAVVLMFSWPSNGRPTDYLPDQADVEWSVPFLARLLTDLAAGLGAENVQVLAHSLGSRGVVFALERLRAERQTRPLIGQLVLMAPDFDAQTFVERLPVLVPLAAGITLYASSNDAALMASRQLHASPRLGEAGPFLTVTAGMQTVDVSPLGRYQLLGHEYFRFHPKAAADLAVLLGEGRDASERDGLRALLLDGVVYWQLTGDRAESEVSDE